MSHGKIARRSRNPATANRHITQADDLRHAANLFEDFRGDAPERLTKVKLPNPKAGLVIGELDGVLYTTTRDGKDEAYIHEFKANSRPLLVASSDGKSLHIIGGRYGMTERGIVDKR